ncbi:hypothetical protein LCGC14_1854590 [marine sediment metagenome]|uniref:Uncharacterized protein n=2 Tax=marine sediment metagenome TaxID=412755 RepID=A0A0F9G9T1_9ZZZZ
MVLMAKKSRTGKIKTPIFEYSWYKEISKTKTNKKFIHDQIDSFISLIEHKDSINISDYKDELKAFTKIIPSQGHLVKLDKEYQDKYYVITKFIKEQFGGFHRGVSQG